MNECVNAFANKLVLTEKETSSIRISRDKQKGADEDSQLCLVGKILSAKLFAGDVVLEMMKRAWLIRGTLEVKSVGENIFFFKFGNRVDLVRARNGGPWQVDQNALILTSFDGTQRISDLVFKFMRVWIRVFDLPFNGMTLECAKIIGNAIGRFVEWDKGPGNIAWGKYMRVRVEISVDQPLMRGCLLSFDDRDEGRWVSFKYEKLPCFCYKCGLIGHKFRECEKFLDEEIDSDSESFQYPKALEVEAKRKRRTQAPMEGGGSKEDTGESGRRDDVQVRKETPQSSDGAARIGEGSRQFGNWNS